MSKAKLEDGYVRIARLMEDALCSVNLSGAEFCVAHWVIRYSYGYNRKTVTASVRQICAGTGLGTGGCHKALSALVRKRVLLNPASGEYGMNTRVNQWPCRVAPGVHKREQGVFTNVNAGCSQTRTPAFTNVNTDTPDDRGAADVSAAPKNNSKDKSKKTTTQQSVYVPQSVYVSPGKNVVVVPAVAGDPTGSNCDQVAGNEGLSPAGLRKEVPPAPGALELTSLGVTPRIAEQLAAEHPLERVREVCAWAPSRADPAGSAVSALREGWVVAPVRGLALGPPVPECEVRELVSARRRAERELEQREADERNAWVDQALREIRSSGAEQMARVFDEAKQRAIREAPLMAAKLSKGLPEANPVLRGFAAEVWREMRAGNRRERAQ